LTAPREFHCCECGRHIIVVVPACGQCEAALCAQCLFTPGWFTIPELRMIIDPDHDGREAIWPEPPQPVERR
jgi:hypothetical protein